MLRLLEVARAAPKSAADVHIVSVIEALSESSVLEDLCGIVPQLISSELA